MLVAMWIFGLLSIVSGCGVVAFKKSLHSALSLVATLFFVSVHFALLGADFLAALQILIYAGAIMILVCFVIMLLGLESDADRDSPKMPAAFAAVFVAILFGLLMSVVNAENFETNFSNLPNQELLTDASNLESAEFSKSGAAEVGKLMLEKYLFPFELSALLLLAAIIGAVSLAYEQRRPLRKGRGLSAMRDKFGVSSGEDEIAVSEV